MDTMLKVGAGGGFPIPTDYSAHWKSGDGLFSDNGVTPIVNGATVYRWNSRNGSHPLIQATAGSRPTYATNVLNGLPSVDFAASDWIGTTALQNNTSTIAFLFQLTATNLFNILYDANTTNVRSIYKNTADYAQLSVYSPGTSYTGLATNNPTLMIVRYEVGVARQVRINQANAGNFTCNAICDGPSRFCSNAGGAVAGTGMKLFEAMEYPRILSDAEVLQVEAYFANRFAL